MRRRDIHVDRAMRWPESFLAVCWHYRRNGVDPTRRIVDYAAMAADCGLSKWTLRKYHEGRARPRRIGARQALKDAWGLTDEQLPDEEASGARRGDLTGLMRTHDLHDRPWQMVRAADDHDERMSKRMARARRGEPLFDEGERVAI